MRFRTNRHLEQQIAAMPEVREKLRDKAQDVKASAQRIAEQDKRTGYYARHFVVSEGPDGVTVGNTDPFAHLVEFGSINNAADAPLRRGVRAAGLDLRETT